MRCFLVVVLFDLLFLSIIASVFVKYQAMPAKQIPETELVEMDGNGDPLVFLPDLRKMPGDEKNALETISEKPLLDITELTFVPEVFCVSENKDSNSIFPKHGTIWRVSNIQNRQLPYQAYPMPENGVLDTEIEIPAISYVELGPLALDDLLELSYCRGRWKSWGTMPTENPDSIKTERGDACRLAIADANGKIVHVVPAGTAGQADQYRIPATGTYYLQINTPGPLKRAPGAVTYRVKITRDTVIEMLNPKRAGKKDRDLKYLVGIWRVWSSKGYYDYWAFYPNGIVRASSTDYGGKVEITATNVKIHWDTKVENAWDSLDRPLSSQKMVYGDCWKWPGEKVLSAKKIDIQ